jgi:replicative DNA helicase
MEQIEFLILRNLLYNEEYTRKVLPFIKDVYFEDIEQRVVFEEISKFVMEYNSIPTKEILCIDIEKRNDVNEEQFKKLIHIIETLNEVTVDFDWLMNTTEKWCKDRAIYLAIMESIQLVDNKGEKTRDAIPSILQDALSVSFDINIGHDYLEDFEDRFNSYRKTEEKIPFDLEYLNKITKGGLPRKTLSIFMASTGVGKSLCLCHIAASALIQNRNVLYITLEMSEEKIAERIDANLLDVNIQTISDLSKSAFDSKVNAIAKKTQGRLIIKEYPTASAHCGHFRSLLTELSLKKSFTPDIIFVDYMNICSSSRYKSNTNVNSYTYVKSIAEELRGLAVEYNVPLLTATQVNRSGSSNTDMDITDTSESFGGPMTADLLLALISTEEFEEQNKILIKQLKNRYSDPTIHKRFFVGIERSKMRLYDVDQGTVDSSSNEPYNNNEPKSQLKEKFGEFKF